MAYEPAFSREELILCLDLYIRLGLEAGNPDNPEVRLVSGLLRSLGDLVHKKEISENYRSPGAIAMRASNWRALHEEVLSYGKKGLGNIGSRSIEVWNDFLGKEEVLRRTAKGLRDTFGRVNGEEEMAVVFSTKEVELPDEADEAIEGLLLAKEHFVRERNKALIRRKKEAVLAAGQELRCEACALLFSEAYGPRGDGFIEVHHTLPLSELPGVRYTSLGQLALLCANCHRMVHYKKPWLSIAELRELIRT